jgi:hypothetical protein
MIDMEFLTPHLIAFGLTVVWHIIYIYVIKSIARNQTYLATVMNMIAWVLFAVITINYVDNNWLLLSSMLGAGVGTFITMKYFPDTKHKENGDKV